MKRFGIIILFLFIGLNLFAQKVDIRIYSHYKIKAFVLTPMSGKYEIIGDGIREYRLKKHDAVYISFKDNRIIVKCLDRDWGVFDDIRIVGTNKINSFRIKPVLPNNIKERTYDDDVSIEIVDGELHIINNVELENYIAGVVETESGTTSPLEYYKSQAIICRTYVLANLGKHKIEGFNLCDGVHCQAYKSKALISADILEATSLTKGLVLVDSTLNLITAAFHANCGGETAASEDVWISALPYLRPIDSKFAMDYPGAKWEKIIPAHEWKNYLKSKGFSINEAICSAESFEFLQDNRKVYYTYKNDSVKLREIRRDWKLRSTFFSVVPQGEILVFKGKGYGHGVGMCQESAMQMAREGFTFDQIINYFYQRIHTVSLRALDFFKQSGSSQE